MSFFLYKYKMPLLSRGIFSLVYFLFLPLFTLCQPENYAFNDIRSALAEKPKFDWDVDSRNSFIASRRAGILGLRVGVNFDEVVRLGLGYNFLFTSITRDFQEGAGENVLSQDFRLRYGSLYGEYVYYRKQRLKMTLQMLLGIGGSQFKYEDSLGSIKSTSWRTVVLYEPHLIGDYTVLKYLSVGAGLGYRLTYSGDSFSRRSLNSPIYIIRANILIKKLYEDFNNKGQP